MTKVCSKCGVEKDLSEFYRSKHCKFGVDSRCKVCCREYQKTHRSSISVYKKKYDQKNREKIKEYSREYRIKNKDRINKENKKYVCKKRQRDPAFMLACRLRSRIWAVLNIDQKTGSAVRDLGCSIDELKERFESLFYDREDGTPMTWDNQGEWHIDHIKPLASFDLTDREQFLEACHYSNLQPLWAEDNLKKGAL
jgi:hypothetical protein